MSSSEHPNPNSSSSNASASTSRPISKYSYSPADFTSPLTTSARPLSVSTAGDLFSSSRPVSALLNSAANEVYAHDPWSAKVMTSHTQEDEASGLIPRIEGTLSESALPFIYHQAFHAADPIGTTASIANVHRVLASSGVSASTIEQILSASCGRSSRVSKTEFSIALAAVTLAQQGKSPFSVQRVISRQASLPIPTLDLGPITLNTLYARNPQRSLPDDPWCPNPVGTLKWRPNQNPNLGNPLPYLVEANQEQLIGATSRNNPPLDSQPPVPHSRFLPHFDPHQRDFVSVRLSTPEGWILKYNMYSVDYEKKSTSVPRRYSDFVWLHECLLKRYPFRLIPSLPPKRIVFSARHLSTRDEGQFIERRRRGLQRFLTCLVNHPVLSKDSILTTFLSEPSDLATWKSHSTVHLIEESATSRLTPAEEMSIPENLDNRLISLRSRLPLIIEHWGRICSALDRVVRRTETQAADFIRIQLALGSAVECERAGYGGVGNGQENQADWQPPEVRRAEEEIGLIAHHVGRHSESLERRAHAMSLATGEQVRAHRELFMDFTALLGRFDNLSGDDVDHKLKPRAEINTKKLEDVRAAQKPGWENEIDRLKSLIEVDRGMIESKLKRRVFIRWCLWQEFVLIMRSGSLIGKAWRKFADDERRSIERNLANWHEVDDDNVHGSAA